MIIMFPDLKDSINNYIEESLGHSMSNIAINNFFSGGNANGYALKGGKLSPQHMSIVTINTPSEFITQHQSKEKSKSNFSAVTTQSNSTTSPDKKDSNKVFDELKLYDREFKKIINSRKVPQKIGQSKIS